MGLHSSAAALAWSVCSFPVNAFGSCPGRLRRTTQTSIFAAAFASPNTIRTWRPGPHRRRDPGSDPTRIKPRSALTLHAERGIMKVGRNPRKRGNMRKIQITRPDGKPSHERLSWEEAMKVASGGIRAIKAETEREAIIYPYLSEEDDNEGAIHSSFDALLDYYLTTKELAEHLGAPIRTVEDWKAKKRTPPLWVKRMILKSFACLYYTDDNPLK